MSSGSRVTLSGSSETSPTETPFKESAANMQRQRRLGNVGQHKSNRRQFLATMATATAAVATAPTLARAQDANSKLNIAIIGVGGAGGFKMDHIARSENIVALCDVSEAAMNVAAAKHPNAKKYTDYRKLYEHASEFDAVVVSTPEHTHAFATLPALQLGKHVLCEKPLAYNIWETRVIREAAAKTKLATQMGIQIHAGDNYRRVVELVESGAIGPVKEAHVWVGRAWGWQSDEAAKKNHDLVSVRERPEGSSPVPPGLDWDLWLGPAPYRPFHEVYFPGPKWYRWWDFGNGTMSDLGSHWNDLAFWALKLHAPLTVEAFGPVAHAEIAPASMRAVYEYGARGDLPPVTLTWYQGEEKPEIWKSGGIPQWDSGVLFVGTEGRMILSNYDSHLLLPEAVFKEFKRPEPYIPKSIGHYDEWVRACKTGEPTTCNFEYSGWLTEANHLGNVAFRVGEKIHWDSANMKVTNTDKAAPFIRREYRKGWNLA